MSAAPYVIEIMPFHSGCEIGMPGTGDFLEELVVGWIHILVPEEYGKRSACCPSGKDTADYLGTVRLKSGRSSFLPALTAENVCLEVFLRQFKSGRHPVKDDSDAGTMGFTENGYPEISTECIHNNVSESVIKSKNFKKCREGLCDALPVVNADRGIRPEPGHGKSHCHSVVMVRRIIPAPQERACQNSHG